ncbi:PleD family two-component system response regulator [Pedobacter aquatilis]|uniref:response regulator n=1 Tax=Pedobacter aquatilis TaxID=351343 RepID=UPI0029310EDB|nr:response regulator [Pedobacter aquatilis]
MPNRKILICDDDEGILDVLELMLADISHEIICEINSLNVPMLIEREQPDLVILDLWMPVVSGDQLLKVIRTNPATKHLPVMIISASRDGREIALAAGASAYVAKPFDMDNLLDTVEGFLN